MSRGGILPFKLTEDIKISQRLVSVLSDQYPKGDVTDITKFCQEIEKLRKILDFSTIQKQTQQDFRLSVEFEPLLIQYYSNLVKLDFLLSKCFNVEDISLGINFTWNNSFNSKSNLLGIEKLDYEIISILYNLSIIYYYQGIYFISFHSKSEKLKGIAKLRNFLWGIHQIESRIILIETQVPSDLDSNMLKSLSFYVKGLIYSTFAEIHREKEIKTNERLVGMLMKSGRLFEDSLNSLKYLDSGFLNLKQVNIYKTNISYNLMLSKFQAYSILTQILIEKAKEDSTKGYMGNAVYYTQVMKDDIEVFTNKSEFSSMITKDQRDFCSKELKSISKLLEERTKLNDRLYVDKEIGLQNLETLYDNINNDITYLEPSILNKSIIEELHIMPFTAEKLLELKDKLKQRIDYYRYEISCEVDKIDLVKETIYKRYDVKSVLAGKYSNFKEPEIPNHLQQKIKLFNQKGGLDALLAQSSIISTLRVNAEQIINKIDKCIIDELTEDQALMNKYGKDWDRKPSSTVNGQLIFKLKDLRNRLEFAMKNDQKNLKGVEDMKNWMILFQSDITHILEMFIPKDLNKSQNIITNISKKIIELDNSINSSYKEIINFKESYGELDDKRILAEAGISYKEFNDQESMITSLLNRHIKDFDKLFDLVQYDIKKFIASLGSI